MTGCERCKHAQGGASAEPTCVGVAHQVLPAAHGHLRPRQEGIFLPQKPGVCACCPHDRLRELGQQQQQPQLIQGISDHPHLDGRRAALVHRPVEAMGARIMCEQGPQQVHSPRKRHGLGGAAQQCRDSRGAHHTCAALWQAENKHERRRRRLGGRGMCLEQALANAKAAKRTRLVWQLAGAHAILVPAARLVHEQCLQHSGHWEAT